MRTVYFDDLISVEQLPWEVRKYLKWRITSITPNVVKHCLARSGFRITKRNHDWLGCWGKHMKSQGFKALREYQKVGVFFTILGMGPWGFGLSKIASL
ncbi:hypothetical protein DPMN_060789 [Dreissena polymorpha]|uniref:Uncharacterized protein n=2 Tax=Dreissena polymorpha TaxID=45954 RepID=A0A9D4C5L2_DREPO|nr:hypothetical protein DPMN_060285 [Dreissena polymorpha]KAH3717992.1 hypothetical protein DPMN_060789 [Dreissena polymorpha]